jgi:hypothetical protein
MEMVMKNGFAEMSTNEAREINGGFVLSATLFTIWGVAVTGTMCVKAGIAVGLAASAIVALKN